MPSCAKHSRLVGWIIYSSIALSWVVHSKWWESDILELGLMRNVFWFLNSRRQTRTCIRCADLSKVRYDGGTYEDGVELNLVEMIAPIAPLRWSRSESDHIYLSTGKPSFFVLFSYIWIFWPMSSLNILTDSYIQDFENFRSNLKT